MFTLPVLEEEIRIPLDKAGFPGVVAVARTLDVEDTSRWTDAFPEVTGRNLAATHLVKQQLLRIEGLELKLTDGSATPYDHSNPLHWRSLPLKMRNPIYTAIMARVGITGDQEVKSDLPSGSGGTGDSGSSPVDPAASGSATS